MPRTPSPAVQAVLIATAVVVALAVMVSWFSWPAKELAPRDLPVVVTGPGPATASFADRLRASRPGAFDITVVADANAADALLRDRAAYAAFVLGADGLDLHLASAASPVVATLLSQTTQQLSGGRPASLIDVVPNSPDDPRGTGLAAGYLPLVLAGMVAGILFVARVPTRGARLLALIGFALLAGLVGSATLHGLGLIGGGYVPAAGAIALLALALGAAVAGLAAILGPAGIGLGVLIVFVFGNPISGVVAAPELLPRPWGAIGQLLPPGAGVSLLRSVAFFGGAGSTWPLWTLAGWSAVGLLLVAVGRASVAPPPAPAT